MGYTAVYDEETDRIRVMDGNTVLKEGHAMEVPQFKYWARDYPNDKQPIDPKMLRRHSLDLKPDTMAELIIMRFYKEVNDVVTTESSLCPSYLIYKSEAQREQKVQITKVVLVGSGSFHEQLEDPCWCQQSRLQLAAALKISEVLGEPEDPLPIFAQELRYSTIEKEYLRKNLRVTVIDDPDAFALIDKHTMLIFCCLGPEFAYEVSKGPFPGAMITGHPTNDGASDALDFSSDIIIPAVEMFRHYNKREICLGHFGLPFGEYPRRNEAFDDHQCLWIRKDDLEELRPTGLIPPVRYRIIRKDENGIEYTQLQCRVIKETDGWDVMPILQDEQGPRDSKDGEADDESTTHPNQG
ncbi:hypothetical protein HYALB_00013953 [Hymenoscyphus albidus]|uniref:SRR1-like domain-containing protein n=1 Tax=Hymenoscyphus albidus TaxID=595503 RepID=A0A9N9QB13_9HELO|nr:hypothetical protein HYALB_00013953 [Hymenoscyphus albidus]